MVQYSGLSDLLDKVRYFLSHDDERERIASNGYRTAIENHTYTHRAREICDVMSRHLNDSTVPPFRTNLALYSYGVREAVHRIKNRLRFT